MKAIVLSDTHIPHRAKDLPERIKEEINNVDIIIHAGDFTAYDLYLELKALKPIYAVRGNMDDDDVYDKLPETMIFELEGVSIGLYHGIGAPWGIEKKVLAKFKDKNKLDLIIFGHSHRALKKEGKPILFNPGSPTDRFFAPKRSYGILEIKDGKIVRLEHVFL